MPGPPPKPASQRRRRNAAPETAHLPAAGRPGRAPTLPGAAQFLPSTREWWKTAWRSPMATAWLESDRPVLVRLAHLIDLTARELEHGGVTTTLLAEIRQLEDRLGLSPLSRRRLQWEIDQAAGATTKPASTASDRFLRAVS